jgi:glycosyltransferase involved in cell wall biosynthesis
VQAEASQGRGGPRILIVTLAGEGGVAALVERAQRFLAMRGWRADLAWYEPYRITPKLSVPLWALPIRRPRLRSERQPDGALLHRVGVRLPELEAGRYRAGATWRQALAGYDFVLAVCGSILQAGPGADLGLPCLAWVSSPFDADRAQRRRRFAWPRRLLDSFIDAPLCRREERRLLRLVPIVTNSDYTRAALLAIEPRAQIDAVVPWPLAAAAAALPPADSGATAPPVLGFAGRLSDPRKNVALLLDALALLQQQGLAFSCRLAGQEPTEALKRGVRERGLDDRVAFLGRLDETALARFYRGLDLFVVPSEQEGLSIVALEAMAAGLPIVSTRCGGPEDFIVDGETGLLVGHDAADLAAAIRRLVEDRALACRLGTEAARRIGRDYAFAAVAGRFWQAVDRQLAVRQLAGQPVSLP